MRIIKINTEYIKLQQLLKLSNISNSGSDIKYYISKNMIKLNGNIVSERGKKIRNNDIVEIENINVIKVKQI